MCIRYMLLWQKCFFRPSTWEGVLRAVEQYLTPINLIYTKYTEGLWAEEFRFAAQLGSQSCMYGWYIWQERVLFFRECTLSDADLIVRMEKKKINHRCSICICQPSNYRKLQILWNWPKVFALCRILNMARFASEAEPETFLAWPRLWSVCAL